MCVDVPSLTEAVLGKSMKLTCISCMKREEVKAKTRVDWYYMAATKEKKTHVSFCNSIVDIHLFISIHNSVDSFLFLSPRYINMKMPVQLMWMDHLKAAWPGMGAKICKMCPL